MNLACMQHFQVSVTNKTAPQKTVSLIYQPAQSPIKPETS